MWRPVRVLALLLLLVGAAAPAHADATVFLGLTPTTKLRVAQGVAVGAGLLVVGFEVEGARILEHRASGAPSLSTLMGNVLVQTPTEKVQAYGTTGGGLYRERTGSLTETHLATNLGGGLKFKLAGPLRLRVDYRLFRLQGTPRSTLYQRVYAGANLKF